MSTGLRGLVDKVGEPAAFCGDPALQLADSEVNLAGARRVICLETALGAFDAIVRQGEGAAEHSEDSHFARFCAIRRELRELRRANPAFVPGHPAAVNPVLRRPPRPEGRVWIEAEPSIAVVDLANAAYGLMLRLLGHAYAIPAPVPDKALAVDLAVGLMRAVTHLGEQAARLPAGPSNPACHAGMSFTTLRDAAPLAPGAGARRFVIERLAELAAAAERLPIGESPRLAMSARTLAGLADKAAKRFGAAAALPASPAGTRPTAPASDATTESATTVNGGVETVEGQALSLMFEAKRCIHARFCVTGAPSVFLANVQGPWLHPDTLDAERLAAIAEACPSGAIRYRRKDGRPDEGAPPVNLAAIREAGPYAFRGRLQLDGEAAGFRATLCRCGASGNKPFCDGSTGPAASRPPVNRRAAWLTCRRFAMGCSPSIPRSTARCKCAEISRSRAGRAGSSPG